jgi:hypothetical protein
VKARCLSLALLIGVGAAQAQPVLLDNFRDASPWQVKASDQVQASLRRDASDGSLCLDYDFAGVSGYAVLRRTLPVDWPAHFELAARLKGSGALNDLQIKLVDAGGDNVWWVNRPNQVLPQRLSEMKIRPRHLSFAWGPTADKTLRHTEALEFVVAAGREGGRGSLCLAGLSLAERAPDPAVWPEPQRRLLDARHLQIDFQRPREFNGLALHWPAGVRGIDYELQASEDGKVWRALRQVRGSDGGLDGLFLPESEARLLRIRQTRGPAALAGLQIELHDARQWPTLNAMLSAIAAELPRGQVPRSFLKEQNYWTLVGVDGGGARSGLISEDGAIEVGRAGFSVEPLLRLGDGRLLSWADVKLSQTLREGYLPQPAVHWRHADVAMDIEAAADGPREAPELLARYRLRNTSTRTQTLTLVLALRPWQVNPPQQFLSTQGGVSPIHQLQWRGGALQVNGRAALRPELAPQSVQALAFDGGLRLEGLLAAPALAALNDSQALASAALQFPVTLAPGESRTLGWVAPLSTHALRPVGTIAARFDAAASAWRQRLNRTTLTLPPSAQPIADTLRSALAQILMSRDGPALQPGTRSYARSWVRDGAMMVAGLVRLGELDAAREFVDWFGERVYDSGKVPCCVDQRGADPVVENDSHGQYLYAVAEVWRHTHDAAWLARHWPRVQRVSAWIEQQRQSERTAANRVPERAHLFGLMPPSISHEGYSDKPAYAYWDDFWTLRGLKDAVLIAQTLGHTAEADAWARRRDEFQRELVASIAATSARYQLGYIAGAADRGDFDATSTTMALNPAQAEDALPAGLLAATFERYWQDALGRIDGGRQWHDYTPYELRTVGTLVRLGQAARAHALLDFFFKDQRPAGWNQWAEVVLPRYREARFLGDMPHAWISSDYIRSALDLFAYEREAEHSLVIGAGLKPEWLAQGDIEVRGLSTAFGLLDYQIQRRDGGRGWTLTLPGRAAQLQDLSGGIRFVWPGTARLPRASHRGQVLPWQGRELLLPAAPATIELTIE